MPTPHDVDREPATRLPDTFQTGFVQAMLFTQGIVKPTARDLAHAVRALQEYRLVSEQFEVNVSNYRSVSRRPENNSHV